METFMLQEKLKNYNIILASQSPRRKELLKGLGIKFNVKIINNIEEKYPDTIDIETVPEYLSKLKFSYYIAKANDNDLIITADTIVCIDGQILGKPKNADDAKRMLNLLSGKQHKVVSGVTIGTKNKTKSISVETLVTFKTLSENEINFYIENYKPFDKAGSYGVQEWIGYVGVTNIEGSYFNIMGLPVQRLYEELLKF